MALSNITALSSFTDNAPASPAYFNAKFGEVNANLQSLAASNATDFGVSVTASRLSFRATDSVVLRSLDSGGQFFNLENFRDGSGDDTTALTNAIALASATTDAVTGGTVFCPKSVYTISSMVALTTRVRLVGENGRNTVIRASSSFDTSTGTWMFDAVNGSSSMFHSWLQDLHLDCNSVISLGGVRAQAWQENSGINRCVIENFRTSALHFVTGFGGASHCRVENLEAFGSTSGASFGIDCQQISAVGGFMLDVRGATITGGSGTTLMAGINMVNDSLIGTAIHFENCYSGVSLNGLGCSAIAGVTGASTVSHVVDISAGFTGRLHATSIQPRSATSTIINRVNSYTTNVRLLGYLYPGDRDFQGGRLVSIADGSAVNPSSGFSSESSLGFYRSGVSTIAPSYGTLNLASNAVRLSMRTVAAASLDSTTLAVNEVAFSIGGASGASLAIRSGSTIWYFSSSASTKA